MFKLYGYVDEVKKTMVISDEISHEAQNTFIIKIVALYLPDCL